MTSKLIIAILILFFILRETNAIFVAVVGLLAAVTLEVAIESGIDALNNARNRVDDDNCIFIFTTKEIDNGNAKIYIHTNDGDTEKTTEQFSGGWNSPDENNEDIDGNYNIKSIEIYFEGKFELERLSIACGSDINVGDVTITADQIAYLGRKHGDGNVIKFTPGNSNYIKHLTIWPVAFRCGDKEHIEDYQCINSALALYTQHGLVTRYDCPALNFKHCATEGGTCTIPDGVKNGYISYGAKGKYNLIPFSANTMMKCDNNMNGYFDDPIKGTFKSCCYSVITAGAINTVDTGILKVHSYSYDESDETAYVGGKVKVDRNWQECGGEDEMCTGLETTRAHWMRYGDDTTHNYNYRHYVYRLITAKNGKMPCTNQIFDDPLVGTRKKCWRSDSISQNAIPFEYVGPGPKDGNDAVLIFCNCTSIYYCYREYMRTKKHVYHSVTVMDLNSAYETENK